MFRLFGRIGEALLKVGAFILPVAAPHLPWWAGAVAYGVGHLIGVNVPAPTSE